MEAIQKIGQRISRSVRLIYHSRGKCLRMRNLKPPYPIRVGKREHLLNGEDSDESRGIYAEVVLYDGYGLSSVETVRGIKRIADIGANIGAFSILASLYFPEAEIHAYDPHPVAFDWLSKNVSGTNVIPFNLAVADKAGELKFDIKQHATLSGLSESGKHIVRAISPAEIFPGEEIDFLKLDCEGAEFLILNNVDILRRTKRLAMEYHLDQQNTFKKLVELIVAGGHEIVKIRKSELSEQFGILWSVRAGR